MISEELRECDICKETKHKRAFVGSREICRACWLYLSEEEKADCLIVTQRRMSYYYNKREWEKEKLARQILKA